MKKLEVYIVHGYRASPNDHWFAWLSQKIQQAGHFSKRVVMAHSAAPDFQTWQECLKMQIPNLNENTIIVAHSLGCCATLHYLNSTFKSRPGRIRAGFFVAGFLSPLPAIPELNDFIRQVRVEGSILQNCLPASVQFISSNDSYVPPPLALQFGHFLNAQMKEVRQAGHFMKEDGYAEFQQLWELLQPLLNSGVTEDNQKVE